MTAVHSDAPATGQDHGPVSVKDVLAGYVGLTKPRVI